MSKMSDILKSQPNLHRNSDESWGTDDHDGDILKGLAAVVTAIGGAVAAVLSAKKK